MKIIFQNLKKLIVVLTILILIIIIGVSSGEENTAGTSENIVGSTIMYIEKLMFNIGKTFSNAFSSVQNISKINDENQILRDSIYKLQEENRILRNIVNTSEVLEAEYDLQMNLQYDYVKGQIIAIDDSNWFSKFTIDKGAKDGLKKNDVVIQAVETDEGIAKIGLVGVVSDVGYNWAKVTTIIDENCKVSFIDIENNESGIINGSTNGTISGFFLDNKTVATVGDDLFTSGIGSIYFEDIYIGKISKIEQTTDASSTKIYVEPVIDFTNVYDVFVLKVNR